MLKPIIYKPLALTDRFNIAFPDNRIPNGYIDKSKTRIGITYTHFHDTRHSIGLIPSVPIIEDTMTDYHYLNLFAVMDGVTNEMIAEYLQSDAEYKRIVTTPESFWRIIAAATSIGKLQWVYDEFAMYLDEVHCYASEAFREDILTPFNYVWNFKNMAMGTATAFEFSNPRIKELQRYKLTYEEKFGEVTIVNHHDPKAVINYMLTHPEMFPGNVHIWFNTVTHSGDCIAISGVEDVNLHCRDDEKNMVNLEDARVYFKPRPVAGEYKKFNFYSSRYNDGWNLIDDENATIILVTDVHIPHSLVGIPYKGFQAIGRLNVRPHKIYHITNNYGKEGMTSFEDIQAKWLYNADKHIAYYNKHITNCKHDNITDVGLLEPLVKPFCDFKGHHATLNNERLDQIIYKEHCKEHYNNPTTINDTWQSMNYDTRNESFDLAPIIRVKRSQEEINKQVIERIEELDNYPKQYVYEVASATLKKYKTEFQLLFEAYKILGKAKIEELGYNDKQMKTELIQNSNRVAETKLRLMLIHEFKHNTRYTKRYIKDKLQQFYDDLGIKKPDGARKIATAEQIKEFGLFEVKDCKNPDDQGKVKPGFEIVKVCYTLKLAA